MLSGTKCIGRISSVTGTRAGLGVGVEPADDVLEVEQADARRPRPSPTTGIREKPGAQEQRHRLPQRLVVVDRDHVGARHHDLAHDGVAELEDRVDHLALVGLDHARVAGQVDQVAQLGLALERAVAVALARA